MIKFAKILGICFVYGYNRVPLPHATRTTVSIFFQESTR